MENDASKVLDTVAKAESRLGYIFEPDEVTQTVEHTIRKCQLIGADEDYFYLLLDNELQDCLMRKQVNFLGEQNLRRQIATAV